MNSRISKKEQGLIKGALRRVFSRSELRRSVLQKAIIKHSDPLRPRVTRWGRCEECKQPTALYQMQIDHKIPLVPLDKSLEDMSWDEVVTRLWCDESNLSALCKPCHKIKSLQESKLRRKLKKEKENKK